MNLAYKSIWNAALGTWVAVSEITRSCGKRSSARVASNALPLLFGIALASALPVYATDYYYTSGGNVLWNQSPNGGFGGGKPLANDRAIYNQGSGSSVYVTDSLPVGQFVYQAPYTGTGFTLSTSPFAFAGMLTINGVDGLGVDSQVNQQIIMSGRTTLGGSQEWRIISDSGSIRQWTNMGTVARPVGLILGANTLTLNPVNAANSFDLDTPISGTGGLAVRGAGTVRLNAVNTYTGGTAMNGGTTQVSANNNLGDATGALSFGGGTLHTTAGFTMNRATTLNAGGGVIDTDAGTTLVQNAVISGIGGLGKQGAGTLQLTGINTYTGATTISAGTLSLTGAGSIAQSSKVAVDGTFNISGVSPVTASIKSLSSNSSGIVTLGAKTLNITNANDTFAGSIQGAGGFTLSGGNLTLTGNNTFSGARNISGGNLRIENGGQISGTTATSNIASGTNGSLVVTGVGSLYRSATLTVGSNAVGQFRIENGATSVIGSTLTLGTSGGTGRVTVTGAGSQLNTSGIVMGVGTGSQGFLDITDGAKVIANGIQFSQLQPNGWGIANVSGSGSLLQGSSINVSSGIMNVLDQAAVQATGTLIIGGRAAHFGEIRVAGGSTLNSNGAMTVGTAGNGVLTIAQGGIVTPGTSILNIAIGAASTGVLNIGGAEGGAAETTGTLAANSVLFGAGTGRINFNHTDANYLFNPIISGNGTINQNGPGLTRFDVDNVVFTGTTNVNAGTLSVNGILGGAMNVNGGRLQGTGQVGDTTNFAGGTIAPGNSIGTLLIAGNYIGSGGVLEIEALLAGTGSPADRLLITGNASGNTSVNVINTGGAGALTGSNNTDGISIIQVGGTSTASTFQLAGGYAAAGPYQYILKAFDPAASAIGEVDPLLGAVPFWDYRLQSLVDTSGNPVAAPQVAGYQALPTGAVRYGASLIDSVHKRLGEIRETAAVQNQIGSTERSHEVFFRTQGSSSDVSGNTASGYDQDIWYVQAGGNLFGRDMADGAELRIGGALSIGGSKLNADESSAKVDLRGTTLALTSTYQAASGWYVDAVAQGTRYSADITTSQRGRTGDPRGWGWGVSLESGMPFDVGNGLIVEPQAQLSYQRIRFDRFTDIDDIDVNLNGGESLRGRFGGRVLKTIYTNIDRQWTPYVEANLLHEFLSDGSITASNVRFDSESMGTSLQFGGGLNARFGSNSTLFASISYEKGLTSASADIWGGNVGLRVEF